MQKESRRRRSSGILKRGNDREKRGKVESKRKTGKVAMNLRSRLNFFVNGKEVSVDSPNPELTLASYIRNNLGLSGTKLACEEGACGACTVVIAQYDADLRKPMYRAANACTVPIFLVDGCSVLTVEGIGSVKRMHPIQERLAQGHGTQCGFCSPGFVMSLYALLRNHPNPTRRQIDEAIRGNLCRCTGYRPIVESFYSFSQTGCCGGNGDICACKAKIGTSSSGRMNSLVDFDNFQKYDPTQEIIFPPKLLIDAKGRSAPEILSLKGKRVTLIAPPTLDTLFEVYRENADHCKIITTGLITRLVKSFDASDSNAVWISLHRIQTLKTSETSKNAIIFGAGLSITQFTDILREHDKDQENGVFAEIVQLIEKYSSTQVRNIASWVGSLCSASSTSDFCSVALALGCTVNVLNLKTRQTRNVTIDGDFFEVTGAKTALHEDEIVTDLELPIPNKDSRIVAYKFGKRHGGDSTLVNAVGHFCFAADKGNCAITNARIAVGGVMPKPWLAKDISDYLCNKEFDRTDASVYEAVRIFESELKKCNSKYKNKLCTSQHQDALATAAVYKMLLKIIRASPLALEEMQPFRSHFTAQQDYNAVKASQAPTDPIGRPIPTQSANVHTTGEAVYTSDVRALDMLHGALVQSKVAHAKILSIDWGEALKEPGVVGYACVHDIPEGGTNQPGLDGKFFYDDTPVFAKDEVGAVGQIIGIVAAETIEAARRGAQKVKVEYEPLPAIFTIQEAIKSGSYHAETPCEEMREWKEDEDNFKGCAHIVEGEVEMGGQDHVYMETQAAICIPGEADEWVIYSSSQRNSWLQLQVASVLGIPKNTIVVKVKRAGGAFGGKDSQCVYAWGPALVAANKLRRPVRCALSRREDLLVSGTRHPIFTHYKIGCDKQGRLVAADFKNYLNGGYTIDYTIFVAFLMGHNTDGCYRIPHVRVQSYSCKTNIASNTAMRGFGIPQAYFVMETALEHLAHKVGIPPIEFREMNHAELGWKRLSGDAVMNDNLFDCWKHCKDLVGLQELQRHVTTFNKEHRYIKRGLALSSVRFGLTGGGMFEQSFALVQIYIDGSVGVSIGGIELGQGLNIKCLQVASRALGVPLSKITMLETSTDKTANAPTTGGSQNADIHGTAIKVACETLMSRLKPVLDEFPKQTWEQCIWTAYQRTIPLSVGIHAKIPRAENNLPEDGPTYFTTGVACIVAEIDALTGEHRLINVTIVMDCGDTLNPAIDIGQIEGGFMQGYGLLTTEEYVYDENGQLLTDSLDKYKIPTADSIPEKFHVALLKESTGHAAMIYSSKGIGEPPLILGTAAFMAIRHAIEAYIESTGRHSKFLRLDAPLTGARIREVCNAELAEKA